ncbi:hypothetical protein ACVWWJ_004476 [Luteibacter sp. HA06]
MREDERDDSPAEFQLSRRKILLGGTWLIAATLLNLPDAIRSMPAEGTPYGKTFMELSRLLINHVLSDDVGLRLAAAMLRMNPELPAATDRLLAIAHSQNARVVEDFFEVIPEGRLKDAAHSMIAAWYMGVIVDIPEAEVFAYEEALMFKPTIDVMTIPTYAISGPNGWSAEAPPLTYMPKF